MPRPLVTPHPGPSTPTKYPPSNRPSKPFCQKAKQTLDHTLGEQHRALWQASRCPHNILHCEGIKFRQPAIHIVPILVSQTLEMVQKMILTIRKPLTRRQLRQYDGQTLHMPLQRLHYKQRPHWHQILVSSQSIPIPELHISSFVHVDLAPSDVITHRQLICPVKHVRRTWNHQLPSKRAHLIWCSQCKKGWAAHRWSCPCGISWLDCNIHFSIYQGLNTKDRGQVGRKRSRSSDCIVPMTPTEELAGLRALNDSNLEGGDAPTYHDKHITTLPTQPSSQGASGSSTQFTNLPQYEVRDRPGCLTGGQVTHTPDPASRCTTKAFMGPKLAAKFPHLVARAPSCRSPPSDPSTPVNDLPGDAGNVNVHSGGMVHNQHLRTISNSNEAREEASREESPRKEVVSSVQDVRSSQTASPEGDTISYNTMASQFSQQAQVAAANDNGSEPLPRGLWDGAG